jgi:hypothetical protein
LYGDTNGNLVAADDRQQLQGCHWYLQYNFDKDNDLLNFLLIFFQDHRVDPSAKENEAIGKACKFGHKEIVEILMRDSRVNPSDSFNRALRVVLYSNYSESVQLEILKRLLRDRRVDPNSGGDHLLFVAKKKDKELWKMIHEDARIDPYIKKLIDKATTSTENSEEKSCFIM